MSRVDEAKFRQILADEFQLRDVPAMGDSFVDDLAFDSMDMVDVIVFLEELAGRSPGRADQYPVIGTVEDAYAYLQELQADDALPPAGGDGGVPQA